MTAFVEAVKTGSAMPIPVDELITTTEATLLTQVSASSGRVETTSRLPGV
jgi:hypothetical protein